MNHELHKKALNMRTNTRESSPLSPHNCKTCHTNVYEYTCIKFICISYLYKHMYTLIHTYTHTYTCTSIHVNLHPCPCHEPRIWVTNYIHKSCGAMACKSKNARNISRTYTREASPVPLSRTMYMSHELRTWKLWTHTHIHTRDIGLYSQLQIMWHRISRSLCNFVNVPQFCPWDLRLVPGNKMVLIINPMKILVRQVLGWKFIETISNFCVALSAIGCTYHETFYRDS